jgi:charged multivesicular body protein 7
MKSYESSTATLRSILAHPSLRRDKIEQTMDALAEANADARDVEEAIRVSGDVALGVEGGDDDELEDELRGLVIEVEAEKTDTEKLEGLNAPESISVLQETTRIAEYA